MFDFYDRVYVFDLHANNPKTGAAIARASCTTDTHGAVIALSTGPDRGNCPDARRAIVTGTPTVNERNAAGGSAAGEFGAAGV